MYKCLECGHIFDEGEQVEWNEHHGLDSPPYERFSGCPICKNAYESTVRCKDCGGEFLIDELYCGRCKECIFESINYDSFLSYSEKYKDTFMLFMFECWFGTNVPERYTEKLYNAMKEIYLRVKAYEQMCECEEFLNAIKRFIMEDDGECGIYHFAKWLEDNKNGK